MDPSEADDPHQQDDEDGVWAWFALPWVMSSIVHSTLLLVVALLWIPASTIRPTADPGIRVNAKFEGPGDSNEADAGPDGLNFSADAPGASYFHDDISNDDHGLPTDQHGVANEEPSGPSQDESSDAPRGAAGPGISVQNALAAVTSDKPPASFRGLLPGAAPGAGGRGDDGGVGNARGLTSGTAPSNRLGKSGYASTSVFGAGGQGYKFVYVFDRSGSMGDHGGAPLAAAKAQLLKSLADLGQTHQFQIIFYNDHPAVFNPTGVLGRLTFATEQNKTSAESFVRSITADGSTEHEEALELALRMAPDVIFFLTDADDPRLNADQLAHMQTINHGTCINCIEFGYGVQWDTDNFLVKLARQNYGKHVYVDVSRLKASR